MAEKPASTDTPAGQQGEEDEVGFGAAFAERAADPQRDEVAGTQQDEEQSSSDEAAEAASTEAAQAAADTGTGTEAEAIDPFAGMSPEQKAYWQRLEASERSNRGRVSALNRKLREGTRAAPAAQTTGEQAQTAEGEEATVSDLDKRLQAAVEEYGDVVGPLADALKEVREKLSRMEGTVSTVEEAVSEQELADAYEELGSVHPDYADLAKDENFNAWLGDQPQQVIELANSFDPRDVSMTLTLFKAERSAALATQTGKEGEGEQVSTATDTRRARQLEGSRAVPSRGAPAAAGVPNDFRAAFKARASAPPR